MTTPIPTLFGLLLVILAFLQGEGMVMDTEDSSQTGEKGRSGGRVFLLASARDSPQGQQAEKQPGMPSVFGNLDGEDKENANDAPQVVAAVNALQEINGETAHEFQVIERFPGEPNFRPAGALERHPAEEPQLVGFGGMREVDNGGGGNEKFDMVGRGEAEAFGLSGQIGQSEVDLSGQNEADTAKHFAMPNENGKIPQGNPPQNEKPNEGGQNPNQISPPKEVPIGNGKNPMGNYPQIEKPTEIGENANEIRPQPENPTGEAPAKEEGKPSNGKIKNEQQQQKQLKRKQKAKKKFLQEICDHDLSKVNPNFQKFCEALQKRWARKERRNGNAQPMLM